MALEDDYRAYRETIAAALRVLRPGVEVQSTTLEALEEELERFEPQVVICSGNKDIELRRRFAWIELSLDPTQATQISVGGRSLELTNPRVEELLSVMDELGVTNQY